ncbi:MAG: hypothetical protein GX430_09670, partial [Treponema sp.]|nr:hypothetical protein [Treponema sp.]
MSGFFRPFALSTVVLIQALVLVACPNPITDEIVLSAKDIEAPTILVSTPA